MHRKITTILVAAALTLGLSAVPAEAHSSTYPWDPGCGPFGLSQCGHSSVNSTHRAVSACDDFANGEGFATEYRLTNATTGRVVDPNGSASGCGTFNTPVGVFVDRYRPCRVGVGCLATWKDS